MIKIYRNQSRRSNFYYYNFQKIYSELRYNRRIFS